MKKFLAPFALVTFVSVTCVSVTCVSVMVATGCLAAGIHNGAAMQVKANSIWFQSEATLTRWQALKKGGNAAALESFEDDVMLKRDASQFTNALPVKILKFEPKTHQVNVEMTIGGRMHGSTWWVDAGAVVQ